MVASLYRLPSMTKKTYCIVLLLPALFYYLALDVWPEKMASFFLGWPLSVLLGLLVMAWAIVVGLVFARCSGSMVKVKGGVHEKG